MIGRYIFICDPLFLRFAEEAAIDLQNQPDEKSAYVFGNMGDVSISMFAKRLKRSIRVQQVKP
jgi:hypothetical protein